MVPSKLCCYQVTLVARLSSVPGHVTTHQLARQVYWVDRLQLRLVRSDMAAGNMVTVVTDQDVSPEDIIEVDWVHNLLFWFSQKR